MASAGPPELEVTMRSPVYAQQPSDRLGYGLRELVCNQHGLDRSKHVG